MNIKAYCIYIHSMGEGRVPLVRDEAGQPYLFKTQLEAQREIADYAITRLNEFLSGEREFDDAIETDEYIEELEVMPDGSIIDDGGKVVGLASPESILLLGK